MASTFFKSKPIENIWDAMEKLLAGRKHVPTNKNSLFRALEKFGPVGLIHVDAHADANDTMMGCKIAHGTTFRRAVEEGLLDQRRVVQIGLRGTSFTSGVWIRLVLAEECWHTSMAPLMDDIRKQMGKGPVYVSLDIDALDPCFAPRTGCKRINREKLRVTYAFLQKRRSTRKDFCDRDEICEQFGTWLNQLPLLSQIEIPRWLNIDYENEDTVVLHVFSDASKRAYATCAFLRAETIEGVKVQLVSARSRIAPIKELTIPRLELLSCLIGARLAKTILSDLKLKNCRTVFWSDSSTALGWIRRDQAWGTFVHNRVQEIRSLTRISDWRHVPGSLNPADLPSRGCTIEQLQKSAWWEGPSWLYLPEDEWPHVEEKPDEELINKEKRKTILTLLDHGDNLDRYYKYFSSYRKTVRMIAWIFRFYHNLKNKDKNLTPDVSVDELENAEKALCRLVQKESFTGINDPAIRALRPIVDQNGILRAKTNVLQRQDNENFRYPIILPSKHLLVERETNLRETSRTPACWLEVEPGFPPEDRVREGATFEVVGVDLAGPLYLREGSKAWIVLYTCAIYRAIHLELVTSLSTETFIQSLRRFIARRGRPYVIYSDNGTNFVGTNSVLKKVNWNAICSAASIQRIRWKFNPPTAAWWGGWWERLVRMVKENLRRVLGRTSLNYEELYTILCDCEQVINSRPITYVSEDNQDPSPLTPMMFPARIAVIRSS
ncbi:uncharacterized protein LOC118205641 [Stegodyphus dumicola]|uniref:uncharacterized protein LOC118205641 n=1 Tax=Stegodyphus dumicola TaxID=202533 RepID=UPI0015AA6EDF|nr:uncharacterized protein LOC118205641 [Stegodyphus dumicola]